MRFITEDQLEGKIMENAIYKVNQLSEMTMIPKITIYRWIDSGKLPSQNPGGHHRVLGRDLIEFLRARPRRSGLKSKRVLLHDNATYQEWLETAKLTGETVDIPKMFDNIRDLQIYKTKGIAEICNVGMSTVCTWIKSRELRTINPKGHPRILGSDLKAFIFNRYALKKMK